MIFYALDRKQQLIAGPIIIGNIFAYTTSNNLYQLPMHTRRSAADSTW